MYLAHKIRSVHLELTTRCNASCPQCGRNLNGGKVNPNLPIGELPLEAVQSILTPAFLRQIVSLRLCGNYGDPMMHTQLLDICRYIRGVNSDLYISMHTNGSGRSKLWWQELAPLVSECHFGIDGLEDTNSIYRRHTVWAKVMASSSAFIEAGGRAIWDFLMFDHNVHQLAEASQIAARMGFYKFVPKATNRFFKGKALANAFPIRNGEGRIVGYLNAPRSPYTNRETSALQSACSSDPELKDFLLHTPVNCKASEKQSIYINSQGVVFPCCWTATVYSGREGSLASHPVRTLIEKYSDLVHLDATKQPLVAILADPVFTCGFPESWKPGSPDRLRVCAKQCGAHPISQGQYPSIDLPPSDKATQRLRH